MKPTVNFRISGHQRAPTKEEKKESNYELPVSVLNSCGLFLSPPLHYPSHYFSPIFSSSNRALLISGISVLIIFLSIIPGKWNGKIKENANNPRGGWVYIEIIDCTQTIRIKHYLFSSRLKYCEIDSLLFFSFSLSRFFSWVFQKFLFLWLGRYI